MTEPDISVNSRRSYGSNLCTVRFVGKIPQWPGEIALGVEWDEPSRGKHGGELNGVQYFETRHVGAGSFVKLSKKSDEMVSFETAVLDRYVSPGDSGQVQLVGITKRIEYVPDDMKKLSEIHSISLSRQKINPTALPSRNLVDKLSTLTRLDLGFNLFSRLSQVYMMARGLTGLRELNLNGNRMAFDLDFEWKNIQELSLASTDISQKDIQVVGNYFPDLKRLCLSSNGLTLWHHNGVILQVLDLSFNQLALVNGGICNTQYVNLSHNNITRCDKNEFTNCVELDIRYNQIGSWDDLNIPLDLQSLRVNGNPVFDQLAVNIGTVEVLGRYGNISKLNGMSISAQERVDAELYFMSKLVDDEFKTTARWKQLIDLHGEPLQAKSKETLKSKLVTLNIHYGELVRDVKVLKNVSTKKLKLQAARSFNLKPLDVTMTSEDGTEIYDGEIPNKVFLRNV